MWPEVFESEHKVLNYFILLIAVQNSPTAMNYNAYNAFLVYSD